MLLKPKSLKTNVNFNMSWFKHYYIIIIIIIIITIFLVTDPFYYKYGTLLFISTIVKILSRPHTTRLD